MKRTHPLLAELEHDPFVSVESVDIDEAIQDALDLSQASLEALAVRQADQASGHIQYSLESLHRTLTELNAAGGVTAAQLQLANLALESNCQRLELPVVSLGISLESFTEEAPQQPVALDQLEGVIKTVDANHTALAADSRDACDRLCEVLKTAIPNAAARLASIVARAESGAANNNEETVPGKDISVHFMNGDSFPENFTGYLSDYIEYGECLVGPFAKAAHAMAVATPAFREVSFDNVTAFCDSVTKAFGQIEVDPRYTLKPHHFELCLPGDGPLFADSVGRATAPGSVFHLMDNFAHQLEPIDPSDFELQAEAPESLKRLSYPTISTVGRALHTLAMQCDVAQYQEDGTQGGWNCIDDTIAKFSELYDAASEEVVSAIDNEVGVVMDFLSAVAYMARWTGLYFYTNLVQTINAFIVYAERSLGSPATVAEGSSNPTMVKLLMSEKTSISNEGIDTTAGVNDGSDSKGGVNNGDISLEGTFKWRTGMRVKYSGGHGKIIKVFERPTKYKGQIHHCTKDNPRYEVRSEKGNHLSLHRASALSPA